jgi:AcrR family transcriptional regulator
MKANAIPTLRQRQTEETRTLILDTAMTILARKGPFSHEAIAAEAGVGPRTVYRHFPSRVELYAALWQRLRTTTNIRFPQDVEQILPLIANAFRSFEDNAELVRASMASEAGNDVRAQGAIEARAGFRSSLAPRIEGMPEPERRRLIAVCLAIYSAPFWQMLRDRGELSQAEAEEAGVWAMKLVLNAAGVHWPEAEAAADYATISTGASTSD